MTSSRHRRLQRAAQRRVEAQQARAYLAAVRWAYEWRDEWNRAVGAVILPDAVARTWILPRQRPPGDR